MKINIINNTGINFQTYFIYHNKNIYRKSLKIKTGEEVEIHFNELRNMNGFLLILNRLLFGLASGDSNGKDANQIINEDLFIAKLKEDNYKNYIFTISKDFILTCDKEVSIIINERINNNPRIHSWKPVILISLGFLFLIGLIALSIYLAGGPF